MYRQMMYHFEHTFSYRIRLKTFKIQCRYDNYVVHRRTLFLLKNHKCREPLTSWRYIYISWNRKKDSIKCAYNIHILNVSVVVRGMANVHHNVSKTVFHETLGLRVDHSKVSAAFGRIFGYIQLKRYIHVSYGFQMYFLPPYFDIFTFRLVVDNRYSRFIIIR